MSTSSAPPARAVGRSTYFFGALGGLLFGYDLGVVAGALLFLGKEMHLTDLEKGLVTSSLLVGGMIGAVFCGRVTDRYGRRFTVLLSAVLFAVGAIGAGLAQDVATIIVFRVIMGLAVGAASVTVPVYLSEIAPARDRGRLSGLNQLMISSGILLAYLVNLGLSPLGAWRWMFALAAVPSVALFAGAWFQPESPRWLLSHGREDDARAVLARSRTESELEAELAEIREVLATERRGAGFRQLFADRRMRAVLLLGIGLAFLQQIIGINTIIYYAPTILTDLGYGDIAAIAANAGLGVLTVIITVLMLLYVVDRVGRRRPLILGALGMCAAMLLLAVVFFIGASGGTGWLAILGLAAFKICFSLSWGGMVWILLGEIFPLRVRGTAMGVATLFNWLGNFLVGLLFPVLLGATSGGTVFAIFAVLCVVACGFAYKWLPETKGHSLERIEERFGLAKATE